VKVPSKSKSSSKPKSQHKSDIDPIDAVVRDVRAGKPVIVVDDAERENEGDLIIAAEKATAESVNFMVRFGRGMICAPITQERAARLAQPHGAG
jgi:3,4-dihydroxy 2-butanone 4-phosphate synthase/GTP cyclohydrolase II